MVQKVIRVLSECNMPVVLEGSTDYWIDEEGFEDDPYVDYLFDSLGEHAHIIKGYEGDIRVNKFSADIIEGTDYERIKREFGDDFEILEHVENVVEFVPKGFSKATGIKWLCNHLKYPM
jgi:hydroxymethylpyrimidine pyrophosphatase-like HAD family hydrolase